MAMFALATTPLIQMLSTAREGSKQAWFADDAASGGCLESLRDWWDALVEKGPAFGYYPNAIKTFLVVKSDRRERAVNVFESTAVQITTEGRRYLGGALGTEKFVQDFIADKVSDWTSEVRRLAKFTATQPQAAYAAYTHGLMNGWIYALRVTTQLKKASWNPLKMRYHRSSSQVRCGNTVSAPTSCSRGVPQGSVLGPLLFLLYTRKVPEVLSATKTIKSVLLADDILIYCSGKTPTTLAACLSEAATRLGTWLTERGLCINVNKTKAMLLPPKHQQCPADILIRCCDATLSIVNEYKYLGVIIDSTLSWEAHVDSVVSKVAKKIGTLRRAGNSLTPSSKTAVLFVCPSSQTCSTVQMRTGLHSQTHARTDSFDQVNELCEQSSMHRPQHQQRPYSSKSFPPWNTSETQTACSHFPMHTQQGKLFLCAQYQVRSTHSQHTTHHQSTNIHLTYYSTS